MHILIIEDNAADARLLIEAFKVSPVSLQLNVVETGEQALGFLRQQGRYREVTRPDLILLDLNLPGKDGRETLEEIKADPALAAIPIFVLTSSLATADRDHATALGVERFVHKPIELQQYFDLAVDAVTWWRGSNKQD
jgi:chemotaxis family two-component system response regulator Rcp1